MLVSQTEPYLEQYYQRDRSSSDRWEWQVYHHIDQPIIPHSLNVEVPMTEIYRRITF